MAELAEACLRLQRYAERFEQAEHADLAKAIDQCLRAVQDNRGRLSSELITELNRLMQRLSRTGLRHGDQFEHTHLPPLRKPVYLALQDLERAERLAQQLEFFGMAAQPCEHATAFRAAMADRHPAAIIMEIDFVDDSRAQAAHTEMVLNSAGIVTRALTAPLSVMAELAEFQPDLIILDMYMPECLGTELAKVIRQHERHVSVPIIYLSAEDDLDKQLDAMSEGGDDFLTKPIKPRHLIATVRNRAARARSLKARMVRDSLTGLYNHTHTLQLLDDARFRARRDERPLTFAMLDIDHFKRVNDTYGHPMGDRVIKSLALFLKQRLRKTDHIGRYGGEEFAVVLPDTDAESARKVLEEIRQRFAEIHYPAQPHDLSCTFSCGIAELGEEMDIKTLAKQADEALYTAKHGGRNRVEVYR